MSFRHDKEIQFLAQFCKENLDLANTQLGEEYGYPNVPLCVIDAVFSIGVNYTSTRNTVKRFCSYCGISEATSSCPEEAIQFSVSDLITLYDNHGVQYMAERVYQNFQRTSTKHGILKAEAVLRFSRILLRYGVDFLQDVDKVIGIPDFEGEIKQIPGQRSGISLRYFYMLTGSGDFVKPDRMVVRFIETAIGKSLGIEECHEALVRACELLGDEYPALKPRDLDNLIWKYQRTQ